MAKFAIIVDFPASYPEAADVELTLQDLLGAKVQATDNGDSTIAIRTVSSGPHACERTSIQFEPEDGSAFVETDAAPSHLEWATVAALEHLGGKARQKVPAIAIKRLGETSFWERIQLRWRLWGE